MPTPPRIPRPHLLLATGLLSLLATGCFSERSFPIRPRDQVPADAATWASADTRDWLEQAHAHLKHRLPPGKPTALLTADLSDANGHPTDVFAHFGKDPQRLHTIWHNLTGLMHTAQAVGPDAVGQPQPPWPGFEDVWIPVDDDLEVMGRLGLATRDGQPITADCIIILPGLFGDLAVVRTRDIANALRDAGLHVLALETRGFGQTGARYPRTAYTFNILESRDLLRTAAWLDEQPHVRDTGLIGFCWGANAALIAAWATARGEGHISIRERLEPHLPPRLDQPVFRAGVIAFSPCLRFEEIIADCEQPHEFLDNPFLASLQNGMRLRMEEKRHPEVSGSLGRLIRYEFDCTTELAYPESVADALDYLRLLPFEGKPAGDKLRDMRVPVLIVQGVNDPLTSAQNVADIFAGADNPNVAGLVLPGGGHIGFAPYARAYFYGLMLGFFDPERGPVAVATGGG